MSQQLPVGSKIGKVWGWTKPILHTETTEVQHLSVKSGWECSVHSHTHKHNRFYVISGRLIVRVRKDGLWDETELQAGEMTTVTAGCEHQFRAHTDCELIELYWVQLDPGDIQRSSQGGRIPVADKTPIG